MSLRRIVVSASCVCVCGRPIACATCSIVLDHAWLSAGVHASGVCVLQASRNA
ncbi:MAG: hypothetical protein ACK5XO_15950 [Phycisphaerales bacterium]